MKKALKIINKMVADGIIKDYVIGGSIAAMFYTEPFHTKDLDIFVYPQVLPSGLIHFSHIYEYLKSLGYKVSGQFVIIDGMKVDFVPIYNPLVAEAFDNAVSKDYDGLKVKVFSPEYQIAIALDSGRDKDFLKIRFLENQARINHKMLENIIKRYSLK